MTSSMVKDERMIMIVTIHMMILVLRTVSRKGFIFVKDTCAFVRLKAGRRTNRQS